MNYPDKVITKSSPAVRTEHSIFRKLRQSPREGTHRVGGSPESDSG